LVRALSANAKVTKLDLDISRNLLGAKGVSGVLELFTALQEFTALRTLDLSENSLRERGIDLLCEHMPANLQRLVIAHNGIGDSRSDADVTVREIASLSCFHHRVSDVS